MGKDCKYCGAYISTDLDVCPACGKRVKAEKADDSDAYSYYKGAAAAKAQTQSGEENKAYTYKQEYERRYGDSAQPRKTVKSAGAAAPKAQTGGSAGNERLLSYLCYLGVLVAIPCLLNKDSKFVRYHCNQGLVLFIFSVALNMFGGLILGSLLRFAAGIFELVCLIKGIINVSRGEMKELPLIGSIRILK